MGEGSNAWLWQPRSRQPQTAGDRPLDYLYSRACDPYGTKSGNYKVQN